MNIERRFAIIIGINDYDENPLDYCANDALSVAKILEEKCKFQVEDIHLIISKTDSPIKDISGHLEIEIKKIEGEFEKEKHSIFFYFAGHGEYHFSKSGLLFQDTLTEISDIFNRINILQPKYQCYIIDACESGGKVLTRGKKEFNLVEEYIAKSSGILFMYAATERQSASESKKMNHGIFTYYFLDAINNKENYDEDGILTPNRIQDYIARETIKESKFKQTPVIENRTIGYYPFAFSPPINKKMKSGILTKSTKKKRGEDNHALQTIKNPSSIDKQYFPLIPDEIRKTILLEVAPVIDEVLETWKGTIDRDNYEQNEGSGLSIFRNSVINKLEDDIVTEVERSIVPSVNGIFSTKTIEIAPNVNPYQISGLSLINSMLKKEQTKYEVVKRITWDTDKILCKSFFFESKDIYKVSFGLAIIIFQSVYGIGLVFSSFYFDFDGYEDSEFRNLNSFIRSFKINPHTIDNIHDKLFDDLNNLNNSINKWDASRKNQIEKFDKNSI